MNSLDIQNPRYARQGRRPTLSQRVARIIRRALLLVGCAVLLHAAHTGMVMAHAALKGL